MAQKIINARAKNKRDTSANWTAADPVLLDGEIIIVDTAEGETRFKIGDGTKKYSQLPFEDEKLRSLLNDKLDKTATAADSTKLNGQAASYYAADNNAVHKTGDETISGTKTFNDKINGKIDWSNVENAPTIPENLDNVVTYDEDGTVEAVDAIDADTLGGKTIDYFATKSSVDAVEDKFSSLNSGFNALNDGIQSLSQDVAGKLCKNGDTMTGPLVAQNNTNYAVKQVRNIIISTAEPTANDGENGDIWLKYKVAES